MAANCCSQQDDENQAKLTIQRPWEILEAVQSNRLVRPWVCVQSGERLLVLERPSQVLPADSFLHDHLVPSEHCLLSVLRES